MSPDVVNAVVINPEAEGHIRIKFEIEDSTTRHVSVSVVATISKLNVNLATKKVGGDIVNSVGIAVVKFHDLDGNECES